MGPGVRRDDDRMIERTRSAKDKVFRETQYEWECGRGDDKTGLPQDGLAGARYRGRASGRRRHHFKVADSAKALREAYPGLIDKMGERAARRHLAGAARRFGPA